jgi:hypothetical protein
MTDRINGHGFRLMTIQCAETVNRVALMLRHMIEICSVFSTAAPDPYAGAPGNSIPDPAARARLRSESVGDALQQSPLDRPYRKRAQRPPTGSMLVRSAHAPVSSITALPHGRRKMRRAIPAWLPAPS